MSNSNRRKNNNTKSEYISQEQVYEVLDFVKALYGVGENKVYNTELANKELKDLNNNPQVPTLRKIEDSLKNYKNSEEELQGYSEFMYYWDSIFQKTIDYLESMLSFDLSYYCINYSNKSEFNNKEYKDDERRVFKWFQKFNYKQEFKKIVHTLLLDEASFVWLRDSQGSYDDKEIDLTDSEDNYKIKKTQRFALQIMPQNYCKITGSYPDGFLWDFDLNYFQQPNIDVNNYDPSLKKAFDELNRKNRNIDTKNFILNNKDLNKSVSNNYDGMCRTNPNLGAWCFKLNFGNFVQVPHFSPLLKLVFNNDVILKLQRDKDIASAYALLVGEIEMIKNQNVKEKDAFAMNPKTMGRFLNLVQSGLQKNIRPVALPLEETKLMQFNDNSPRMAINQFKTSSNGISSSPLIFTDEKMGQFELQSAIMTDYNFMKQLYIQFENFLNFFVNKKTRKYKFRFKLDGSNYPFEREHRVNNLMRLVDKGITPNISKFASTFGYDIQELQSMLDETSSTKWTENLTSMLQNANTMGNIDKENHRPQKDIQDLTQSGENSRDYG